MKLRLILAGIIVSLLAFVGYWVFLKPEQRADAPEPVEVPTAQATPSAIDSPTLQATASAVDTPVAQVLDLPTYLIEIEAIATGVNKLYQDLVAWQIFDLTNHNEEGFTPHLEKARELFERAGNLHPPTEAQAFHDRFNRWGDAAMIGLEEHLLFYRTGDEQYRHALDKAKQIIYDMQESFYTELRALYTQYDILVPTYGP